MAETTLTHKLRNPKSYNEWMDIWTATVQDNKKYEITPSPNWKISVNNLDNIPVNKIESFTDTSKNPQSTTYNVTITDPDPQGNHIAITTDKGDITEGAEIKSDGNENQFLNQKGEWTSPSHPEYSLSVALPGNLDEIKGATTVPIVLKKDNVVISNSGFNLTAQETDPIRFDVDTNDITETKNITINILPNDADTDGIVWKGAEYPNKVWKTDESGVPAWRDEASTTDTWQKNEIQQDGYVQGFNPATSSPDPQTRWNRVWRMPVGNPATDHNYSSSDFDTSDYWKAHHQPGWYAPVANSRYWDGTVKASATIVMEDGAPKVIENNNGTYSYEVTNVQANKVWKTDAAGNPAWRVDADTTYSVKLTSNSLSGYPSEIGTGDTNILQIKRNSSTGSKGYRLYLSSKKVLTNVTLEEHSNFT